MKLYYNFLRKKIIRLGKLLSLIFFVVMIAGCRQLDKNEITIIWSGELATGVSIPKTFLDDGNKEGIETSLEIRLLRSNTPMLGKFGIGNDAVTFTSYIPLTLGKQYEVYFKKNLIGNVIIPLPDVTDAPVLQAIYPSADTLPENLLKIYLQFSSPMREGEALKHIYLLNENGDTIPNVFLDLQPELWNESRTVLTLWLDPGRIKRNLIPNQKLGNPLQKGANYNLIVDSVWRSTKELSLRHAFAKTFWVNERDDISPKINDWKILLPRFNTTEPLEINFEEPLDYFLLKETVQLLNEKGIIVEGAIGLIRNETCLQFTPAQPWRHGRYQLKVACYLEDLCGNNLNRPFDRDIQHSKQIAERDFVEREFAISDK